MSERTISVKHWNPRKIKRQRRGLLARLPIGPRLNNFGDLLGPVIVREIAAAKGLSTDRLVGATSSRALSRSLVTVGSTMRLARTDDVIWGTGVNGKSGLDNFPFEDLDVRAVRGPLTKQVLNRVGVHVPDVFGDPGLLMGRLLTKEALSMDADGPHELTIIPNLNDYDSFLADHRALRDDVVHPCDDLWAIVRRIALSDFVTGSSLHAIVIAESLGVPARLLASGSEHAFKYEDYYLGSGRAGVTPARDLDHALVLGSEPAIRWNADELIAAFPSDLWDEVSYAK